MLLNKKLEEIYENFIDNDKISETKLSELGFSKEDIEELTKEGKLVKNENGLYEPGESLDLFGFCYDEFLTKIRFEEYEDIFRYFRVVDKTDNEFYKQDNNMWLFILNYVTNIPEEYKKRISNITFEDVKVLEGDERFSNIESQNKVRRLICIKRFSPATSALKIMKVSKDFPLINKRLLALLEKAISVKRDSFHNLKVLVKEKKYEEIVQLLSEMSTTRDLGNMEKLVLQLSSDMISIQNGVIPQKIDGYSYIITDAIRAHDYKRAMFLNDIRFENKPFDKDKDMLNFLLEDIVAAIDKKKIEDLSFSDVVSPLLEGDVDKAFSELDIYMKKYNLTEYRDYIANLLEIDLMEEEFSFTEPMIILDALSKGEFTFDVSKYVESYYLCLSEGDIPKATIYLDIISQSKSLGGEEVDTKSMSRELESIINGKGRYEFKELAQLSIEPSECSEDEKFALLSGVISDVINSKGLVVSEKLSDVDKAQVLDIVNRVSNITASPTTDSRLILRYYNPSVYINLPAMINNGKYAFKYGEYDNCIDFYTQVTSAIANPRKDIYRLIGLSYYNRGNDEEDYRRAVDYLTVATDMGCKDLKSKIYQAKYKANYNGTQVVQYTKK